jgi:hypothetical protein
MKLYISNHSCRIIDTSDIIFHIDWICNIAYNFGLIELHKNCHYFILHNFQALLY